MKSKIKTLLAVLLASTLASSCAAQPPQIAHMEATQFEQEHDEMIYPHAIVDIYPSRNAPHEVIVHKDSGGTADLICLNHNCTESTGQLKEANRCLTAHISSFRLMIQKSQSYVTSKVLV